MKTAQNATKKTFRKMKWSRNDLEQLETRQLLSATAIQPLPFRLDFNQNITDTIVDKDGQGTGFTRIQTNKYGTEYQQNLIDLDVNLGVLKLTTTGTASAGSNAGTDNTQTNALETQFAGTTSGFTITARILGNGNGAGLNYLNDNYEQAGIFFGPDQDNYFKVVALKHDSGQVLQFKEEFDGVSPTPDAQTRISVGSFASINTLDVRIVGDAATGKVIAYYSINGGAFIKFNHEFTVPSNKRAAFFSEASRAGLLTSHKNNVGPITATFDSFEITAGISIEDRPRVTVTRPADGVTNIDRNAFVAADVQLPNASGIDTSTLTTSSVKLYRQSDGALVNGIINTSGGGDVIVFTPFGLLDANTTYVFEITDAVKDASGHAFLPFTSTFTTGTGGATIDTSVSFSKAAQTATQGVRHTSLVFGPDGKLYTTTIDGKIIRYNVGADGTLSGKTEILTIQNREGGRRSVMSLVFDPASTASNLIAYVSHSDFAGLELKEYESENLGKASNWTGKITKLTGANLQNGQDLVVGLPRSVRDHQNYQMAISPAGKLYISQSSMSAMGRADSTWGNVPETLLSAAILEVDIAAIGSGTVNVRTEGLGANNYNPYAANAPVKIYATGLRSAYDLFWHSNGYLYSATNGSAAGGNTPAGGGATALSGVSTQNDYLFRILPGKYYGHPNPLRGEYVLNGGNPTAGIDPGEVAEYPVGTQPHANWGGYIYDYGKNYSPNGMIEYKSNTFDGKLKGSIVGVRYSGGDDLIVMDVGANGGITAVHANYAGLSGFSNPLDVVENPANGYLYVIEFGDQGTVPGADARITLLKPQAADAAIGVASLSRNKVYFSDQTNTSASSKAQTVRVTNTGTGALTINGLSFTGTNAGEFTVRDAYGNVISTPITLQPNERIDLYVTFKATTTGIRTASLNISTNQGTQQVALRALGLAGTGGTLEPSLQRILDLYQIGVNVGDNDPNTTDFPVDTATSADEVTMPRLVKAGSGPVTVEMLGVFANQVSRTTFGWYEAGNFQTKNPIAQVLAVDNQSIAPLADGSFTFDPGSGAFGIYSNFTLGSTSNPLNRDVFSENVLNTWETNSSRQKKVRFYQLKDANGVVVPNAYVVAFEEYNVTFDQNDLVAIIRNVKPAADAPEIGLENRDNTPFADRLVMSRIQPTGWNANLPNQFHDVSTLRIRNTGNQNLNITGISVSNSDFVIESGGGARTLAPGAFVDVVVRFVYSSTGRGNAVRTATLTINNNDPDEATKQVTLSGLWQSHSEDAPTGGSQEPVLQKIIDAFGYKVNVGNQNTNGQAVRAGEEILSELWQRADTGLPVGVVQLAAYHQQYNVDYSTKSQINWYNPSNINSGTGKPNATKIFAHAQVDSQSLLPRLDGSTTTIASGTFNPGSVLQFGFKVDSVFSTDVYNTPNDKNNPGHGIRFYQAKDANGNVIPDTYILAQDYVGVSYANYDYQDNIYLLTNVKPVSAPLAPTGLTATAQSGGIALNWPDSTEGNVTGYNVYRASSSGGAYELITTTPVTSSDYFDSSAPVGATSYYKVTAVTYQSQESAQSAVASAFRAGSGTVPNAPTGAAAAANSATSVTVSWTDTSNNETGFRVERKTGSGGAWGAIATTVAGATSFTDNTVVASANYSYRIVAINAAGSSAASNEATVTTPASQPGETVLTSTNIGNPTPAGTVNIVTAGKDYDVTVGGLDIWGTYDSFHFLHEQKTGDFDVAVRVTDLTAIATDTMAGLMVRETLGTGSKHVMLKVRPNGYRLNYRSSTNGATVGAGEGAANLANAFIRLQRVGNTFNTYTSTDGVNWTPFQSINVSMGSTVYVGMATSAKSNTTATTAKYRGYGDTGSSQQPTAPSAASGLVASASSSTSVSLNWTDNANNETGYRIERKTGSGAWASIATLGANATSYTDSTVVANTAYSYRVIATGSIDAAASNEASVTTPQVPSSGSTITASADAHVLGGSTSTNYGSNSLIEVKESTAVSTRRFGYIRFHLSGLASQDLNTIKLRLYGVSSQSNTNLDIQVFGASDSWNESTINYNNRPGTTTAALGTINVSTAQWHEVDVSAYVKAALQAGATSITFALAGTVSTAQFARFNSRESGSNAPELAYTVNGASQPTVPSAASGLTANAGSATSVTLNWNDNSNNETNFRIERKTGSGSYQTIGTVGANVTTFTDTTAAANTAYTYRIVAFNATGNAAASNEATITTPQPPSSGATLAATADAFVQGGTSANTNYGSADLLQVKSATGVYHRIAYLKFNVSSLSSAGSAKLRLYVDLNTADSINIAAYGTSASWNESTLTYNNRPSTTTGALSTATVTSTNGQWIELDISAYVQQAIANGQTEISIAIQATATSTAFVAINSRTSASNTPELVVT